MLSLNRGTVGRTLMALVVCGACLQYPGEVGESADTDRPVSLQ